MALWGSPRRPPGGVRVLRCSSGRDSPASQPHLRWGQVLSLSPEEGAVHFPEGTPTPAERGASFSPCPDIPHLTYLPLCVPSGSLSPCHRVWQVCSPSCCNWRTSNVQLPNAQDGSCRPAPCSAPASGSWDAATRTVKTSRQQTQAAGEGPRLRVGDGHWGSLARDTLTHLGRHLHTGSSISPPQTDPPTPALDVEPTWPFHPCMPTLVRAGRVLTLIALMPPERLAG